MVLGAGPSYTYDSLSRPLNVNDELAGKIRNVLEKGAGKNALEFKVARILDKDDYASGGVQAPPRSKCYCPSENTTCKFTSAKHFCCDGEIEKYVDTMLSRTLRVTVDLFSLS